MTVKTATLKGKGDLNWAYFSVGRKGKIEVVALLSWTRYINREVSPEEAREIWEGLKGKGWQRVPPEEALPLRTLKLHIYG